ncbi:MAG: cytochrome c3 family protein [Desulfuromonadaceae bacterium]|nr:cytochrome c3 family protein [Desulfuromonadaceae bacterium]MDD5106309.1 cytochrome c3 family protein [Desulfuromonadaceae bacterium]
MKKIFLTLLLLVVCVSLGWASGMMKKKLPPYDYGSVTINNYSQQAGMPPVQFDHWLHRQYATCRLCHVDIGFGMTANSTKIRSTDNMKGYFCGTCHNGKESPVYQIKIFDSCAKEYKRDEYKRCTRCHILERSSAREDAFERFAQKMPRERLGNGINWEKAEEMGLVKPADQLEGVSIMKPKLKIQQDFSLKSKVEGMPDIIFSHKKHTVWNGCELCHPDIFVGIKKGTTKFSMVDIFEGKYCGVCHDKVAFPQSDCARCHNKSPQEK